MASNLLRVSLLLPFMAISSVAHADHNYQHRPNEPRGYGALAQVGPPAATNKREWRKHQPAQPIASRRACTYQGGPKSGLWACR